MASHPYSPLSLQLPGFAPQILTARDILGPFFVAVAIIIVMSWLLSGRSHATLTLGERLLMCWWATTGSIHMVVEGAFAAWPSFYQNTSPNIFSELWKEYSKADSRYAARDSCIVSIESVTAFVEGPLCFLILYAIMTKKPYQHSLQLVVSVGQLYGTIVYFVSSRLDGDIYTAPGAMHYWFYFIFMNAIWIIIPSIVILRSFSRINQAVAAQLRAKQA